MPERSALRRCSGVREMLARASSRCGRSVHGSHASLLWRSRGGRFNVLGVDATPLAGKVIVIVGGTTGMGLSAAHACVGAGGRVVVVGRDAKNAEAAGSALGDAGAVVVGDAADAGTAQSAIERAVAEFGGFHGMYHVAGGSGRRAGGGPRHEMTDDGWQYTNNS